MTFTPPNEPPTVPQTESPREPPLSPPQVPPQVPPHEPPHEPLLEPPLEPPFEPPPRPAPSSMGCGRVLALSLGALALFAIWCAVCAGGVFLVASVVSPSGMDDVGAFRLPPSIWGDGEATARGTGERVRAETGDASGVGEPVGGVLRLPGGDPSTLDPALVGDVTSAEYIYEIFSGLVTLSPELEVVPDLARSWEISSGGTVYTFDLHDDARFHDGTPLTAHAIGFAIERACDPATGSSVAETYLGDIIGCVDKLAGRESSVDGVRVTGDHVLELTIDAPKGHFLAKLTYPTSFALDREQIEDDTSWLRHPNGTGPFRLNSYEPGDHLELSRHDAYYRGVAALDTVTFDLRPIDPLTRYENGELDATPVNSGDIDRVRDPLNPLSDELVDGPGDLGLNYVGFNVNEPPFDDPNVRRAFNLALDKERLATVVLNGAVSPVNTILPPGMPGHDPAIDPYPFDPAAARAALAASRYGSPEAFPPVTLDVPGEGGAPIAQAVADYLSESLGVNVTVEQTPWEVYQTELDAREYDMFMLGWSADYADPQDFLDVLFHSESPLNHTGYASEQVDALLEEARIDPDEATRLILYNEAERQILDDAAWLPVFTGLNAWLVAPYVHNFTLPAIVQPRLAEVHVDSP